MYGEIITIGNELISGRTVDLNAWYAAGRLTASGLRVTRITTVGDDLERAPKAIKESVTGSRFVIITGGLGSTEDDITNQIVAKVLERPLCLHREMFQLIKSYLDKRGMEMSPSMEKMAWMPEGSKILDPRGTACGFSLIEDGVYLYFLPGVPDQMRYLMDKIVLPELLSRYRTLPVLRQRVLKLYGLSEPAIADLLKGLTTKREGIILGFYPHFPENHITISVRGHDESSVIMELDRVEEEIQSLVGSFIFASGHERMESVVGKMLMDKSLSISLAESCTGGLIGNLLTSVSGSSRYFQGGSVVYSNQSKEKLLRVSSDTLMRYGAVSEPAVREMAEGARTLFETDLALAVTGIAGPEGGSREKPVGTVYIGLAVENETLSNRYRFWGTREQIKLNSAMMALDCTRRHLNGDSFLPCI